MSWSAARHGPETAAAREQMKRSIAAGVEMVWPTTKTDAQGLNAFERANGMEVVQLLVVLVFWLTLLFVSFGLFAPSNGTALTILFVGACAVSAAIFLVLE